VDTRRLQLLLLSGLKVRGEISRQMANDGESAKSVRQLFGGRNFNETADPMPWVYLLAWSYPSLIRGGGHQLVLNQPVIDVAHSDW
jgi:hypothetical protein